MSALENSQFLRHFRHSFEQVGHEPVVRHLEDGRLRVLVDGHDRLGVLHAGQMLTGAGDSNSDVQFLGNQLVFKCEKLFIRT